MWTNIVFRATFSVITADQTMPVGHNLFQLFSYWYISFKQSCLAGALSHVVATDFTGLSTNKKKYKNTNQENASKMKLISGRI